jgi:hypothetical protein
VLECLGLSFACGRVEVDGDVMVARLVRLAFKAPAEAGRLHGASCCLRVTWRFASPHALVASLEPYVWAHALVGAGLVVRGGDLSCEAATRVKIGCLAGAGS